MPDGHGGLGHNRPPPYDPEKKAALEERVAKFADAAGDWLDLEKIEGEAEAGKLVDFLAGARALHASIDMHRAAEKAPHDSASKAVQEAFKPLLDKVKRSMDRVKPLLARFMEEKRAAEEAERARKAEEARRAAEDAERKAAEAARRNDVAGEVEAEEARKAAEDAAREAARATKANVQSASGAGRTVSLRTERIVEVVDALRVFMRYRSHPDVLETLRRVAAADLRSKDGPDEIPGIKVTERKVAA